MALNEPKDKYLTQLAIQCMGETLMLNCLRALFRPQTGTLLISDIHLGKEEVFGRTGLALPAGVSETNLERLNQLIEIYSPRHIMILGDLMHSTPGEHDSWPGKLNNWLDQHPQIDVAAVLGNHDRAYQNLDSRIRWHKDTYLDPPFIYSHEPFSEASGYVISGHVHPTHVLATKLDKIRCPIFWFRKNYAVLPAFGSFTGGYNITPDVNDKIYLVGENEIIDLPT